jgi:hypothetical protein
VRETTISVSTARLSEYDDDGFLGVQHDPLGENPGVETFPLMMSYGFYARPHDPDDDGTGCTLFTFQSGDTEGHTFLGPDPRYQPDWLRKGQAAMAIQTDDGKEAFITLQPDDGNLTIYIPVGNSAHKVQVGSDGAGDAMIELLHSDGSRITMMKGAISLVSPNGQSSLEVKDTGVFANGNLKVAGGIDSGSPVTPGMPLVKSTELQTWINTILLPLVRAAYAPNPPPEPAFAAATAALQTIGTTVTTGT